MEVRVIAEDGWGLVRGGVGGYGDNLLGVIGLINQTNQFLKFSLFDHYV